jgi:hypothetical protein
MMHLFCQCGYPISATATWEGEDLRIRLHDGMEADAGRSIMACPQCGQSLQLGDLKPRPLHQHHTDWFMSDGEGNSTGGSIGYGG